MKCEYITPRRHLATSWCCTIHWYVTVPRVLKTRGASELSGRATGPEGCNGHDHASIGLAAREKQTLSAESRTREDGSRPVLSDSGQSTQALPSSFPAKSPRWVDGAERRRKLRRSRCSRRCSPTRQLRWEGCWPVSPATCRFLARVTAGKSSAALPELAGTDPRPTVSDDTSRLPWLPLSETVGNRWLGARSRRKMMSRSLEIQVVHP